MRFGPRASKAPATPEKEAERLATKARNAERGARAAEAKREAKASKTLAVLPGHENAVVELGLMSKYLFNMNHYKLGENGVKLAGESHGHDKAVRFAKLGYAVVQEGETMPSKASQQSMLHFQSQVLQLIAHQPAKKTSDRAAHEKKMEKRAAEGRPSFAFPGDQYSVEGVVTTPSGARALLKTGWKVPNSTGDPSSQTPVLVSAYFK